MLRFRSLDDAADPDLLPRPVVGFAFDLKDALETVYHVHRKSQLIYSTRGVVTVEIERGLWVAPPNCAVWIPGGMRHKAKGVGQMELHCLFVDVAAAHDMPEHCCIVAVSPLLHEMLMRQMSKPPLYPLGNSIESRFVIALLDELSIAQREPLHLQMPRDPRLRKLAHRIIADPSLRSTIEMWGDQIGVSPRTLTRLFLKETGLSFGKWRRQLQLSLALQWLAEGQTVTNIALDLGYENTGAFIIMFRQALGRTPGRYFEPRSTTTSS